MGSVSVVVCAKDCAGLLPASLESIAANRPYEIIVVDGASTDETVATARRFATSILDDAGRGLAYARNLGASAATGDYVAFVGPDNILPSGALEEMIAAKEANGWAGVSAATRLYRPTGYLGHAMDRYKGYRFDPGERNVIGTPTLFDAEVLRRYLFDDALTSSDDADLCERMRADGFRFGISPATVFEQGTAGLRSILERWRWYGQSDAEFFTKYGAGWDRHRKVQSLLHPLRSELILPATTAIARGDLAVLPFLVLITVLRYVGWITHAARARVAR